MGSQHVRILHVIDQLSVSSGVSNIVMGYVRNIDPNKFIIDVAVYMTSDKKLIKEVEAKNGKVYQLPNISFPVASKYCREFAKVLADESYSVVHGHLPTAAFLFLKEAKIKGIPHRIIHAHSCGVDGFLKRLRNKGLIMLIPWYANHYAACSNAAADYVYGKSAVGRVQILLNAIDPDRFRFNAEKRIEIRKSLGIKGCDLCIGHVGRFASIKNHMFLLDAFNELFQITHDVKLVLAGDGELRDVIEQRIRKLNLGQAINVVGECDAVENLYQAFDQFWFPSFKEGWGVAGLEAQCAGLPCLFSENIPKEINVLKKNVKFLSIDNPIGWAKAAQRLMKIERQDTTQAIYDCNLNISIQIKKLENSYEAMLQSNNLFSVTSNKK